METPPIDWPTVQVGDQRLIVRWTFFTQWLLSKRGVKVTDLPRLMQIVDPTIVDLMVECFAAAVAENFTTRGLPAPDAEYWAYAISSNGGEPKFKECNERIWQAVGKARPAAEPPALTEPAQSSLTN